VINSLKLLSLYLIICFTTVDSTTAHSSTVTLNLVESSISSQSLTSKNALFNSDETEISVDYDQSIVKSFRANILFKNKINWNIDFSAGFQAVQNNTSEEFVQINLKINTKKLGLKINSNDYYGSFEGNILVDSGSVSETQKTSGDFKGKSKGFTLFVKKADSQSFFGISFVDFTFPTPLVYKYGTGDYDTFDFLDSSLNYKLFGVSLFNDIDFSKKPSGNDWFFSHDTVLGLIKVEVSTNTRYHLYRLSNSYGLVQDSWGGLGIVGRYGFGHYYNGKVFGLNASANGFVFFNVHAPILTRSLRLEDTTDLEAGSVDVPDDILASYGLKLSVSLAF
jgi:hypothetical protein